jgi:hypothetical protein
MLIAIGVLLASVVASVLIEPVGPLSRHHRRGWPG